MAAVININCVLRDAIDIVGIIQELGNSGLIVKLDKAYSIDNWRWENQQEIRNYTNINTLLQKQKIIAVNANLYPFKDFGLYIERNGDKYIYDFWINTEGFPELDSDIVDLRNKWFFEKLQNIIMHLLEKNISTLELLSVGNETAFAYNGDLADTIQKTAHVFAWMIPQTSETAFPIKGYEKRTLGGVEVFYRTVQEL